jgi:hypothetical protein
VRRKIRGYIFQFTSGDHFGRHIHIYRHDRKIGVYDAVDGPIRGLETMMNAQLRAALRAFICELNERGFFRRRPDGR